MITNARQAALEISSEAFRAIGHELVDRIAAHMEQMPQGPVRPDESAAAVRRALDSERELPENGLRAAIADRPRRRSAVRALAVQRPPALLGLHHVKRFSGRCARRLSRFGSQSELRIVDVGADGH
jgi:hypothetical protein